MKFPVIKSSDAIYLYNESNTILLSIGLCFSNTGYDDITIMKKDCKNDEPGNGCCQHSYEYNGIENALCGNDKFDIDKFFVIQMK